MTNIKKRKNSFQFSHDRERILKEGDEVELVLKIKPTKEKR
jgi:hypothetical protein